MSDIMVVMVWHDESDPEKIAAFHANRNSFKLHNPNTEVVVVKNIFDSGKAAWLGTDITFFDWYVNHAKQSKAKRFLLVEWDCWCNCNLKDYYEKVFDNDLVVPNVKYPERDDWYWFSSIGDLPPRARKFATGISPMCGVLFSKHAMDTLVDEILNQEYLGLNSEIRLGTIATMMGIDPIVNPRYNRSIGWRTSNYPIRIYPGLHHPRKTL